MKVSAEPDWKEQSKTTPSPAVREMNFEGFGSVEISTEPSLGNKDKACISPAVREMIFTSLVVGVYLQLYLLRPTLTL